jgi:hypothetical protein
LFNKPSIVAQPFEYSLREGKRRYWIQSVARKGNLSLKSFGVKSKKTIAYERRRTGV